MSECGDCRIVADFRHFSSQTGFVLNIELCTRHASVDELERQVAMHKARANRAEKERDELNAKLEECDNQNFALEQRNACLVAALEAIASPGRIEDYSAATETARAALKENGGTDGD